MDFKCKFFSKKCVILASLRSERVLFVPNHFGSQHSTTSILNGYSKMKDKAVMLANCTCSMIRGKNSVTIVDTRTAWDGDEMIEALQKINVKPEDITHVICTHGHSDHIGCNYLFQKAKEHIVGHAISFKNEYRCLDNNEGDYIIDEGIRIVKTPGHTSDSISIIVDENNNLASGPVAICGDLFENEMDWTNSYIWIGAGSESIAEQRKSRHRIAEMSDLIVPGHGSPFSVTQEIRDKLKTELGSE